MAIIGSIVLLGALSAAAQVVSTTVIIDSSTVMPINTGIPDLAIGDIYYILAEGAIRPFANSGRYTEGWFGPDGETRLNRGGQQIPAMPYGALCSSWLSVFLENGKFVGSLGRIVINESNVFGLDLYLFLNMSAADLAGASGQIVAHVVYVPVGSANTAEIVIDNASGNPVPTGIVCGSTNDKYIIMPHGALHRTVVASSFDVWFGPAGLTGLSAAGMPIAGGAYGALLGSFVTGGSLAGGFYVQDGGAFSSGSSDIGHELHLGVNMSGANLIATTGQFNVDVIQIPDPALATAPETPLPRRLGQAYPNPLNPSTTIEFSLAADQGVLLRVYDVSGRWIRTLVDGHTTAGDHQVKWDGIDDNGQPVASGTYLYQLSTPDGSETGRVAVVK